MLRKSRSRVIQTLFGSALLLSLPLTTGCQTGNFGGNIPGYGAISGWWGGADKPDPNKPPAGYQMPSSKADPNGPAYAGGANRGARRSGDLDIGTETAGGYDRAAPGGYGAQGASYAAGNRNNVNNWEKGKRSGGESSYSAGAGGGAGADGEGEFAGGSSYGKAAGYGAAARGGERASPSYDPYGGATPSSIDEETGAGSRGAAYTADTRGTGAGRNSPYSTRMASGSQRAAKSSRLEDEGYEPEETAPSKGSSRFSSRDDVAPTRGSRASLPADEDEGAMTADEDVEGSYPQTQGYGSGYKVPSTRGASPSSGRRYPSTNSGATSRTTDDDYGMTEEASPESDGVPADKSSVAKVAAAEPTRYGLSSKAAAMLDRSTDGDFRPGTTSRPGYRATSRVSPVGYSAAETEEEDEVAPVGRTASRFAD